MVKYDERLIPSFVDELAQTNHGCFFALVPKSSRYADGLIEVTVEAFARVIYRVALWMVDRIGRTKNLETVAYIGPSKPSSCQQKRWPNKHTAGDLRYFIVSIAASKLGFKGVTS